jgi:hypothetical protein
MKPAITSYGYSKYSTKCSLLQEYIRALNIVDQATICSRDSLKTVAAMDII